MAGQRFVAVVGARTLPEAWADRVGEIVRHFLGRGWGIGSGGARGADHYALRAVVAAGPAACARSVLYLPGRLQQCPDPMLRAFVAGGGCVVAGMDVGRTALLARSRHLARAAAGVVAVLWGPARGSIYTLREAIRAGKPTAVVVAGGGAVLPPFGGGRWVPCGIGGVAAHKWVAAPATLPPLALAPPTALGRIFRVPDGEPVGALLTHIASLTPAERLWFEHAILAGDTVLAPHERLDDGKPAALAVDRLVRQLRCTAKHAFDLGECLLALDADAGVIAHYVGEARRRGVEVVIPELVALIADLETAEPVPDTDALDQAEALGDGVEALTADGRLAPAARDGVDDDAPTPAADAWHAIGSIEPEWVRCPACGTRYVADDESADLPTCPGCGTRDTWEARQDPAFRALLAAIDRSASRAALGQLGRRLYARRLPRAQAGVAWTHYRIRKAALEAGAGRGAARPRLPTAA